MFCARCGKQMDDNSTFCPFCGQKVGAPVERGRGGPKLKMSMRTPDKKIIMGVAAAAMMLFVVFGVLKVIGGIFHGDKLLSNAYQDAYSEWLTTLDLGGDSYMTLEDLDSDDIPELIVVDRRYYTKVVSNVRVRRDIDAYDFDISIVSYKDGDLIEFTTCLEGSGSSEIQLRSIGADKFIIHWSQFIPTGIANNDYAIWGNVRYLKSVINITEAGFEEGSIYELFENGYSGERYYAKDGNITDVDAYENVDTYENIGSGNYSEDCLSFDRVFGNFDSAVEYYEQ